MGNKIYPYQITLLLTSWPVRFWMILAMEFWTKILLRNNLTVPTYSFAR